MSELEANKTTKPNCILQAGSIVDLLTSSAGAFVDFIPEKLMSIHDKQVETIVRGFIGSLYEAMQQSTAELSFKNLSTRLREESAKQVQRKARVNQDLRRSLHHYDFKLLDLKIDSSTERRVRVSFLERYNLEYEVTEDDKKVKYQTSGELPHMVELVREDGDEWTVNSHETEEFYSGPTHGKKKDDVVITEEAILWIWNGPAAATYSDKFAIDPNPDFRVYENDCTNFASQCLRQGGKNDRDGDRKDSKYWFYGSLAATTSYTWAAAHNLAVHMRDFTNSKTVTPFLDLSIGDLIFADLDGGDPPHYGHTMIVAVKMSDDLLLNYHSSNTFHKSFKEIKSNNPKARFLYLQVGSSYI